MAKKQRVDQRSIRRQRLAPSRHTIAKQSATVLALGLGLAAGAPAEASIVYTNLGPTGQTISNDLLEFLDYPGVGNMFAVGHDGFTDPYYPFYADHKSEIGYNINNAYADASIAVSFDNYDNASLLSRGDKISGALYWNGLGTLAQS